jgi:hypothetical protein
VRPLAIALAVLAAAAALAGCFQQGMYRVGPTLSATEMTPGLWRSLGGSECTWTRVSTEGALGHNVRTNGPQYVQIDASDYGLAIGNCAPFWQDPGPYARALVPPGAPFGDGDFLVNTEIAPGLHQATAAPGEECTWAVVSGFHGLDATGRTPDFVRGTTTTAGAPTAQIEPGDHGFTSQGCGEWRLLPPAPGGAAVGPAAIEGVAVDFPDPFVTRVDDPDQCDGAAACWFAYSTQSGFVQVPVARSLDLATWTWAGATIAGGARSHEAMPVLAPWVAWGANWAPAVLARPGNQPAQRYVMYYTAKSTVGSTGRGRQCIGIATSASPRGPFVDHANAPALCNVAAGGTIDANPYVAGDGAVYLTYADDVAIRGQRLAPDGLALAGDERVLLTPDSTFTWEQQRTEAPSLFTAPDGTIVLLYSVGRFWQPTYSVGAAVCDSPLGPCRRSYSSAVLASRGPMVAPGGQTPFQLDDGSWQLAFHAWSTPGGIRTLHFLPIAFPPGFPPTKVAVG